MTDPNLLDRSLIVQEALLKAAQQFNSGQYWECHETLEQVWLPAQQPDKQFFQGIIQVAAGFHHSKRNNIKGAKKLLSSGFDKLKPLENKTPFYNWIALSQFLANVCHCLLILNTDNKLLDLQYPKLVLK